MENHSAKSRFLLNIALAVIRVLVNCLFYAVVAMLLVRAAQYAYSFAYDVFGEETMAEEPGREVEVKIMQGESTMSVAEKLERNRLINNRYAFYVKAKLLGANIMPGTFLLKDSMTYEEILDTITDPDMSIEPVTEAAADSTEALTEEPSEDTDTTE